VRDLTDLQVEGNRRRALLESAEEITQSGSWEWIPSEGHLVWSDNLYRIFGLIAGEQTPTPDLALERTHPADRAILAAAFENLERGQLAPVAYRIVRDDGTTRYVRATLAIAERRDGRPHRMVGSLQDLTDRRCAEQAIAAHVTVAEALADWQSLDRDAERLLANLGTALGYTAAVLWVPDGDALAARVTWHDGREPEVSRYVTAARRARLRRGAGLPGRAWQRREPMEAGEAGERGESDGEQQGRGTTVAMPVLFGEEVVAVIELKATHHARLTPHLLRSLTGLGHELGQFLGRRREDLNAPLLTRRELDVLRLAASGLSVKATAESLSLSPSTVKTHLDKSYMKLTVSSKPAAVAQALRRGLIE
jgi:DNA-binding CsgD family transcriptional regulator